MAELQPGGADVVPAERATCRGRPGSRRAPGRRSTTQALFLAVDQAPAAPPRFSRASAWSAVTPSVVASSSARSARRAPPRSARSATVGATSVTSARTSGCPRRPPAIARRPSRPLRPRRGAGCCSTAPTSTPRPGRPVSAAEPVAASQDLGVAGRRLPGRAGSAGRARGDLAVVDHRVVVAGLDGVVEHPERVRVAAGPAGVQHLRVQPHPLAGRQRRGDGAAGQFVPERHPPCRAWSGAGPLRLGDRRQVRFQRPKQLSSTPVGTTASRSTRRRGPRR